MKYDDASWHYGGDFPIDLPDEAGATHTGMFVAWAILADLGGDLHLKEFPQHVENLRSRSVTPGQFFLDACDGKFTDDDLNDEGNAFAREYYDAQLGAFLNDYERVLLKDLPSLYHVPDTWATFDRLRPTLDKRLRSWRPPTGWRRFLPW